MNKLEHSNNIHNYNNVQQDAFFKSNLKLIYFRTIMSFNISKNIQLLDNFYDVE